LLAALVSATALWLSGGFGHSRAASAKHSRVPAARPASAEHARTRATRSSAVPPARPAYPSTASWGASPQTHAYPTANSAWFKSLMVSLWDGIVHDSPARAMAAFFPRTAYIQVKAIASASADWRDRLVREYGLDISAAHALLGGNGARAQLVAVEVRSGYGHWIEPGVCYNRIGYYELPNARIVYRVDGQLRSFGIASMISWRGVWFVVHLGAVVRAGGSGTVDEPAVGPGSSAYSATC
jgi:hypothetical protein